MSFREESFFIVNYGIRDKNGHEILDSRITKTYATKRECEEYVIDKMCDEIVKAVNTDYYIHEKHDEYFRPQFCECCHTNKTVFDVKPKTIREARLLSKSYLPYTPLAKSYFVYSISEHVPE